MRLIMRISLLCVLMTAAAVPAGCAPEASGEAQETQTQEERPELVLENFLTEEGFLDLLPIPVVEDPLLKLRGDRQDELVLVQRHCLNVGKPGGDGGLGQIPFELSQHVGPDISHRVQASDAPFR